MANMVIELSLLASAAAGVVIYVAGGAHLLKGWSPLLLALGALFIATALVLIKGWRECRRRFHGHTPSHVESAIPPVPVDKRLLLSTVQMSAALARGDFTSEDIVDVCIRHIKAINPHLNATVFDRFDAARLEARAADRTLCSARRTGDWTGIGWLTGVPISVKECIKVTGCPNTSGLPNRVGLTVTEDAPQVRLLREAGAIVLGVTNVSELCMWMESSNPVYGLTRNPYDVRRIVGGSSGGEGCAVAALFAPCGLGSDIGGSIRMPAYFNGVFGHKPSSCLVPNRGQHPGCRNEGNFLLTTGPLVRHAEDIYPLMRTITADGFLEDPTRFPPCPPMADPRTVDLSRVTLYCVEDLGIPLVRPCRAQRAAVRHAAEALQAKYGCRVRHVRWSDPASIPDGWQGLRQGFEIWSCLMTTSNERTFTDFMSERYPNNRIPLLRETLKMIMDTGPHHTLPALALCLIEKLEACKPAFLVRKQRAAAAALREAIERELKANNGVIITPTYPRRVPTHHSPMLLPIQWVYTAVWNAMQCPATAVPVWMEADQFTPLGVQCVGAWGRDDMTVAVAMGLEAAGAGGYRPPSWAQPA